MPAVEDKLFAPVESRTTIADSVYHQLRRALILGRFDPGQMMTIASLASSFETSHMPVREALRRLGAEGALEMRANGSACVPAATRARLDDICLARVALERLATEQAAEAITEQELDEMDGLVDAHASRVARQDITGLLSDNRDFHFAVYRAGRSEVLLNLIESLWLRYGPFMRMLSDKIEPPQANSIRDPFLKGHKEIAVALRERDAVKAANAMEIDIRSTQRLLYELGV